MWLIDAQSVQLQEFTGTIPQYAILSHTWEVGEILFQDMGPGLPVLKPGYEKILNSCKQALKDGLSYVWVDTCCIDKTNSAILSESMNSMYKWYANAEICYAYLSDVRPVVPIEPDKFRAARWFTRGWTLQELIAPRNVVFYARSWTNIGGKVELGALLESITGIDISILLDPSKKALQRLSIAKKMSWASHRSTSRVEDIAYCLLGLFDVNIPLLYGEGEKAFIRLQEAILKISEDHTIFAYGKRIVFASDDKQIDGGASILDYEHGFLAPSPAEFDLFSKTLPYRPSWKLQEPYTLTNRRLRIDLAYHWVGGRHLVAIDCYFSDDLRYILAFQTLSGGEITRRKGRDLFVLPRERKGDFRGPDKFYLCRAEIPLDPQWDRTPIDNRKNGWIIPRFGPFRVLQVFTTARWDEKSHMIRSPLDDHFYHSVIKFVDSRRNQEFAVAFGIGPHVVGPHAWPDPVYWCTVLDSGKDVRSVYDEITKERKEHRQRLTKHWDIRYPISHKTPSSTRTFTSAASDKSSALAQKGNAQSQKYTVLAKVASEIVFGQKMFTLEISVSVPGGDAEPEEQCQCRICQLERQSLDAGEIRCARKPWT